MTVRIHTESSKDPETGEGGGGLQHSNNKALPVSLSTDSESSGCASGALKNTSVPWASTSQPRPGVQSTSTRPEQSENRKRYQAWLLTTPPPHVFNRLMRWFVVWHHCVCISMDTGIGYWSDTVIIRHQNPTAYDTIWRHAHKQTTDKIWMFFTINHGSPSTLRSTGISTGSAKSSYK